MIEKLSGIWPEWKLLNCIGQGSFGKVYKAVREEHNFQTYSAIKVITIPDNETEILSLRAEGFDDIAIRKFYQENVREFTSEIKLMESLKGMKNIVSIEDYSIIEKEDAIGWYIFIRMEYLTPFNQYVANVGMTEEDIIKLGIDINNALEECYHKNIIHRDIKPQNIFVSEFGDFKLGDFGVAKILEKSFATLSTRGTYNYMAPEVFMGKKYNASVDTYSLGLVLYKLLNNNKFPFVDDEYVGFEDRQSANTIRINGEKIPKPINGSESLTQIILHACEFNPNDRFSNPTEFKIELEKLQQNDAIYYSKIIASKLALFLETEDENKTLRAVSGFDTFAEPENNNSKRKCIVTLTIIAVILLIVIIGIVVIMLNKGRESSHDIPQSTGTSEQENTEQSIEKTEENIITEITTSAIEEDSVVIDITTENGTQDNTVEIDRTEAETTKTETITEEITNPIVQETEEVIAVNPTETSSEIEKNNMYIVPIGCEYYDESECIPYSGGQELPVTPEEGDRLTTKDYIYVYTYIDESYGMNGKIFGWSVHVKDISKDSYEDFFEEIAGEKLIVLESTFSDCVNLDNIPNIPKTVLCMRNTFSGCTSLVVAPKIPDSVISLDYTFNNCTGLIEAPEIPDSVTSMIGTFTKCSNLKEVPRLSNNIKIMNNTFSSCISMEEAPVLPESLVNMNYVYENCINLKNVPAIPDSVRYMEYSFSGCESLIYAPEIGENVVSMQGSFCLCKNLIEMPQIPNSVTNLESSFYGCDSLEMLNEIPEGVINMKNTFAYCTSIISTPDISNAVTNMEGTFYGCSNLITASKLPDEVMNLKQTFLGCGKLKDSPVIPGNVLNMEYTFMGCTGLTGEIVINANPELYTGCFAGVDFQLQNITMSGESNMLEQLENAR